MGSLIYHITLAVYIGLTKLAAPFYPKASKAVRGKRLWRNNIPTTTKNVFWIHCASLGEFEQGRPLLEAFKEQHDWFVLITFFSPTGIEHTTDYEHADHMMYLPWDSRKQARDFYNLVQPSLVCFVKYEFWYHFLHEGAQRNVPVVLVSGIFRPNQLFFKWYGGFQRKILESFSLLLVQNEESAALLKGLNLNAKQTGDLRVDRVVELSQKAQPVDFLDQLRTDKPIFVVGSAWPDDFERLLPVLNDDTFEAVTILAPHEINPKQVQQWKDKLKKNVIRYSERKFDPDADVIILDTVGVLASSYRYGHFAYVGGAFGDGLHNILEPAAFGLPIVFGNKYYDKFQEALDLIALGGAVAIGTADQLKEQLLVLMKDPAIRKERSDVVLSYVKNNQGATMRTLQEINELL